MGGALSIKLPFFCRKMSLVILFILLCLNVSLNGLHSSIDRSRKPVSTIGNFRTSALHSDGIAPVAVCGEVSNTANMPSTVAQVFVLNPVSVIRAIVTPTLVANPLEIVSFDGVCNLFDRKHPFVCLTWFTFPMTTRTIPTPRIKHGVIVLHKLGNVKQNDRHNCEFNLRHKDDLDY